MIWQRWLIRSLNGLIWLLVAWLLAAAAYVSIGRQLVPVVADYQFELVAKAEALSGRHIELRSLSGQMQGSQPVLTLRGLRVHENADPASPVLFDLDDVTARLDVWRSLWLRRPVMDALQIRGLALTLSEDEQGLWHLQGLGERTRQVGGLEQALAALREHRRITLLDTQIRVSPFGEPEWQFAHGEMTLLNGLGWQRLDGCLSLPDGERLRWQISALVPGSQLTDASLGFFLELPASDWSRWLPKDWLERAHLRQLSAGGRFWGSWQDQRLQRLQGTLIAPDVGLQTDTTEPTLNDLFARFEYTDDGDRQRLTVQDFSMHLGEDVWPTTNLQGWRERSSARWSLALDRLLLDRAALWVSALAPNQPVADLITQLAPQGTLRQLSAGGQGAFSEWPSIQFSAALEQVGVQAFHNAPSLSGVSGTVSGSPTAGELRVNSQAWSLQLPNLFPQAWEYERAQGALFWRWSREQGLQLNVPGMAVSGPQGEGSALLDLHLPPTGQTPTMDLRVALRNSTADQHAPYLPLRSPGFSPALAKWLAASEVKGGVPLAIFEYHGSLLKGAAPEERQIGLYAQLRGGELHFQPGWPALTELDGELLLHDGELTVASRHARLLDSVSTQARAQAQLLHRTGPAVLSVESDFGGPLSDALQLLQDGPLSELTGNPLAGWRGEGAMSGTLGLSIPLQRSSESAPQLEVELSTDVQASRLDIPVLQVPIENASGHLHYSRGEGLSASKLAGSFLGSAFSGSMSPLGSRGQRLQLNGNHAVEALRQWPLLPTIPTGVANGSVGWQAVMDIRGGQQDLTVTSDLKGVELTVPAPFGKSAATPRPLELQMSLAAGVQDWQVSTDDGLRGLLRYRNGQLAGDLRYASGSPQPPTGRGLSIQAQVPSLDWESWRSWAAGLGGATTSADGGVLAKLVRQLDVHADSFTGFGMTLADTRAVITREAAHWQINVEQTDVAGRILVPDDAAQPIDIALQRLRLNAVDEDLSKLPLATPADAVPEEDRPDPLADFRPSTLPPLDVRIEQLSWGSRPIGLARFRLRPDSTGARLPELELNLRGLAIKGSMDWREQPAHSVFEGSLETEDIGKVLKAWDYAPTITSKRFVTNAALNWPGSPAAFKLRRASGTLGIEARDGMLQSGETSAEALRVFGLLNFNALTRRLRLDFSDLFSKGTAYDTIDAGLYVDNGVLHSEQPMVLEGPGVKIQTEGRLNLRDNQVDMGMLVTLPVTNNLPLAALIAGAPQIGGVLFLADKILGDKVARFASVKYKISGDWQQPTVEFDRAFDDKAALEED
ncbi:MAG: YhdP family protein [Pseudomonadaceae bacterium]